MALFDRIPERFFSILASPRQEIYVEALFVLHRAFHTELEIRRSELTAMMIDSLEPLLTDADLEEEEAFFDGEDKGGRGTDGSLSGKVQFLVR